MKNHSDATKVAFIMRPDRFGDLLTSMPLVLNWKKHFPESAVTLVVSDYTAPILPFLSGYDKAVILPKDGVYELSLKTLWKIRKDPKVHFDVAISCAPFPHRNCNLLLWALKAKKRMAVVRNRFHVFSEYLINQPISKKQVRRLSCDYFLSSLRVLFPEFEKVPEELYPRFVLPKNQQLPKIKGLSELLDYDASPLIFISTSNNRDFSFPGVSNYIKILNELYECLRFRVIISCLPQDLSYALPIANQLEAPNCIACTKELGEMLSILNKADLLFVGDGGLMHMAAALDKAMVVLFGKGTLARWRPLSKKAICLEHPDHVIKIPQNEIIQALLQQLSHKENVLAREL